MSFTPVAAPAHIPAFDPVTDNNPCGMQTVASVGGVSVQARNLCPFHLALADGSLQGAIVMGT